MLNNNEIAKAIAKTSQSLVFSCCCTVGNIKVAYQKNKMEISVSKIVHDVRATSYYLTLDLRAEPI